MVSRSITGRPMRRWPSRLAPAEQRRQRVEFALDRPVGADAALAAADQPDAQHLLQVHRALVPVGHGQALGLQLLAQRQLVAGRLEGHLEGIAHGRARFVGAHCAGADPTLRHGRHGRPTVTLWSSIAWNCCRRWARRARGACSAATACASTALFIALIAFDRLYLKADDTSRPQFAAAGCEPFVYDRQGQAGDDELLDRAAASHGFARADAALGAAGAGRGLARRGIEAQDHPPDHRDAVARQGLRRRPVHSEAAWMPGSTRSTVGECENAGCAHREALDSGNECPAAAHDAPYLDFAMAAPCCPGAGRAVRPAPCRCGHKAEHKTVLDAREALRKKDRNRLAGAPAWRQRQHPLAPWVDYWELSNRLNERAGRRGRAPSTRAGAAATSRTGCATTGCSSSAGAATGPTSAATSRAFA